MSQIYELAAIPPLGLRLRGDDELDLLCLAPTRAFLSPVSERLELRRKTWSRKLSRSLS